MFKQMENISNFLKASRALGVPSFDCFETLDLFDEKNMAGVLRCVRVCACLCVCCVSRRRHRRRRFGSSCLRHTRRHADAHAHASSSALFPQINPINPQ